MSEYLKSLTDDQLIEKCNGGTTEAFTELVLRHKDGLVGFIWRFAGDPRLAEDIGQEAFLRVYENLATYKTGPKFSTWLYKIAMNLATDALRKKHVRREVSLDAKAPGANTSSLTVEGQLTDHCAKPEETMSNAETSETVRRVLDEMPEEHKLILVLRDVQGLPYEEIAEVIDAPLGTVKSRVNRARLAFKEAFCRTGHRQ
jgi:RNA polymerase sigma-70 factor (ECF subfamily)